MKVYISTANLVILTFYMKFYWFILMLIIIIIGKGLLYELIWKLQPKQSSQKDFSSKKIIDVQSEKGI